MDDPLLVRRFERLGDLPARSAAPRRAESAPARSRSASVGPSTSSITRARDAVRLFEAVNLRDVGMVQRRERLRFALEACQPVGVAGKGVGQDLDARPGDPSLVSRRAIDLAHAALADLGGDFVRAEPSASCQGHVKRLQLYLENG